MTVIKASGFPKDAAGEMLGTEITIVVTGGERDINRVDISSQDGDKETERMATTFFRKIMKDGPHYPLCSEPETMLRASQVLSEQFADQPGCSFGIHGPLEEMEYDPNVIY